MTLLAFCKKNTIEAGCDEAGRGCLAGPVFAASVILPKGYENPEIKDSKKLTENKRYLLREEIEKIALSFSIAKIDNQEIDRVNIFKASMKAMHKAIDNLSIKPELLLIDGHLTYQVYTHSVSIQNRVHNTSLRSEIHATDSTCKGCNAKKAATNPLGQNRPVIFLRIMNINKELIMCKNRLER